MERKAAETVTVTYKKWRIEVKTLNNPVLLAVSFVACLALLASCGGGDGGGGGTALPSVTTLGSDSVSASTASINVSVNPNGIATEYWFEWATDKSLTNPNTTEVHALAASSSVQVVSHGMTGLTKGTTFFYRLCARNANGTVQGKVKACYHYANVVFVTSAKGTGNLGSWAEAGGNTGIGAGDAICQTLADGAGLQGEFKAWLSDSTIAARNRLARSAESYVRVDGARVAYNWSDLTAAPYLEYPIVINEQGSSLEPSWIWTDTRTDGSQGYGPFGNSCLNWVSGNYADRAAVGGSHLSGWEWTEWGVGACDGSHPLYCFQQNLSLQEHFNTGCSGPIGWKWHVSACSNGLFQDPACAYICCNFYNGTSNCNNIPSAFGGYTVNSCSYNTGLYTMGVSRLSETFTVTCQLH